MDDEELESMLPGATMNDSDSSSKYKPVEPLTLQGIPDTAPQVEPEAPKSAMKPKRKRRTSVQMAMEGLGEAGGMAVDEGELKQKPSGMKGRLKSASNKVGGAGLISNTESAKAKKEVQKKGDDTARDLHSRRDVQLAMKAAYKWVALMGAFCFVLVIIELQILTDGYLEKGEYTQTAATQVLKSMISACSLVSAFFMTRYYHHWYAYLAITQGTMHIKRQRTWLRLRYLGELLLVTMHVPPGLNITFSDDHVISHDGSGPVSKVLYHLDICGMVVLLRVYLLPRCVLYFSELWSSNTVTFVAAMNEVQITTSMAMKAIFSKQAIPMTFFTCLVPLVTCSYLFSFCERLADPFWADGGFFPYNAFYNMFLSFAGEVAAEPATWGGRVAVIIQVILGMLGTALLLSLVFSAMVLDPEQQTLLKTIAQRKRTIFLKLSAARTIQRLWRLFAAIKSAQASGEMSPIARDGLLRTRSFKLNEKDIDNMVKGDDMRVYKKHVWGVMRDWKRAKRAPLEFIEDFQTTLQITSQELLSKVRDVNDDVHALTTQVFGANGGDRSPSPLESKILKVEAKLAQQVSTQQDMQAEMKVIAESLISLKNLLSKGG